MPKLIGLWFKINHFNKWQWWWALRHEGDIGVMQQILQKRVLSRWANAMALMLGPRRRLWFLSEVKSRRWREWVVLEERCDTFFWDHQLNCRTWSLRFRMVIPNLWDSIAWSILSIFPAQAWKWKNTGYILVCSLGNRNEQWQENWRYKWRKADAR